MFVKSILNLKRWSPVLGVEEILISVMSLLDDPNINSPVNVSAAVIIIS